MTNHRVNVTCPPPLKCINSPKFSKSFTLSEVLITLGVIGIMAALTLPTVISKYKRKSVETKLAKFYSVMNEGCKNVYCRTW